MRQLTQLSAAALALCWLAACGETYDYRSLANWPEANCEQTVPQREEERSYWVFGETPDVVNWSGCDKQEASLARASLHGALLENTDFTGADLSSADLRAAELRGAKLQNANLTHAKTMAAHLRGADLRGANMTGMNLTGTDLAGTDMSGATWIDGYHTCGEGSIGSCDKIRP